MYLRALLEGLADLPQRSEELRDRLRVSREAHPAGYLHRVLRRLDPEAARKIATGDEQKLIRAIEICLLAKRPLSEVHRSGRTPLQGWRALKIGLNPAREALYARIHARTEAMLEHGWLDEVRALVAAGATENAKAFEFIGYRELRSVLRGEMKLEEARAAIQQVHPPLRQAPADLVSTRGRRSLGHRIRRRPRRAAAITGMAPRATTRLARPKLNCATNCLIQVAPDMRPRNEGVLLCVVLAGIVLINYSS